ncbi:MAG TPA: hypothetical protein VGE76_20575, partial [Opitutaceae bacterium]
ILIPALDAITAGEHLALAGRNYDAAYLGFNVFSIFLGACLAIAAGKVAARAKAAEAAPEPAAVVPLVEVAQEVRS